MDKVATARFHQLDSIALYQFHGGIHPPENKLPAAAEPLLNAGVPKRLHLPLPVSGSALKIHVQVGDRVLKGQLLASDKDHKQPPIHASTSALISAIEDVVSSHPSGISVPMITLESDGEERWIERQPVDLKEVLSTSAESLIDKLFGAGITGMGGAGFPTATKLRTSNQIKLTDNQSKTLLLNGAECEPYISCDDKLMQTAAIKILQGAQILSYCIGAEQVQIAVEDNKIDAITSLRQARNSLQLDIAIITIPTKYPSGGEKQLIEITTGKQVPKGQFPAHLGITVQNLATACAVYDALINDTPVLERIVTVAGQNLQHAANYTTLIGTPVEYLLQKAGYQSVADFQQTDAHQIIMGGPMMGHNLKSLETPITKTTNCIIAPSATEIPLAPDALACIRCGLCTDVCPANLLPQQLYWHSRALEWDKTEQLNLFDCIECGACSYVCPSHIPLVDYYRFGKDVIANKRQEKTQIDAARVRFEKRQLRLDQLQQEKAQRRHQKAAEAELRKNQRLDQDNFTEVAKKQSVADAVARVNAKKQLLAQQSVQQDQQDNQQQTDNNEGKL